jgi:hypothetical protein
MSQYFFNFSFLVENLIRNCDTMRSESPFTSRIVTPLSISKLRPRIKASYSDNVVGAMEFQHI